MAKIYLTIVGLLYAGLAVWCVTAPVTTSAKVGFTLNGDTGRSEFMTVYGGLEFGLALVFLLPLVRSGSVSLILLNCILIHASLVAFRLISLAMYRDAGSTTYKLAGGELLILLVGIGVWYFTSAGDRGVAD